MNYPARLRRAAQLTARHLKGLLCALTSFTVLFLSVAPQGTAQAQGAAGYSEYYIPGATEQMWDIFENLDNDPDLVEASGMHNVTAVTAALDNTTIYYDHWEDGYDFDPADPVATADESYVLNSGDVREFESSNIPIPRGTAQFYDGRDRIFVAGGPVTVTGAHWPESIGTVFSLAWEIYPTKPFLTHYTIPVGQDLAGDPTYYADFTRVYVIVQSTTDDNNVVIDDPATGPVDLSVTLDRGEVTQLYSINAGTTVAADDPVQVQFIAGQANSGQSSHIDGYSAVPDTLWDNEYYSPVGSAAASGGDVDLFVYNPNSSTLTISFEDLSGSGTFTIPANTTRSYSSGAGRLVPVGSGVHLSSTSLFWGIGSGDTESATWDWGYSLVPAFALEDHYFLGWAPGSSEATPTVNGSPAYITPVQDDTTVFVDYSPTDGTADLTFTLNRLETRRVFDPDRENTGMHIWATGDIAVAWGEDPDVAAAGTPYLDLGYSTIPFLPEWMDQVLEIEKSADPTALPQAAGQTATFTLVISTFYYPVNAVDVMDTLPPGWVYVPGSTTITPPVDPPNPDPSISGQELTWDLNQDMGAGQTLTVEFDAQTTAGVSAGLNQNDGQAVGTRLGGAQVFAPIDSAFVYLSPSGLTIDKDTSTPIVDPGTAATYSIVVTNEGSNPVTNLTIGDDLPTGFSFASAIISETNATRTATTNPSVDDNVLTWGTWTINPGGNVTITYVVNVAVGTPLGTYDDTATANSTQSGPIDDAGTAAQDRDTPSGQDPEDDEDVVLTDLLPTVTVTKTPGAASIDEPGGSVTFTVTVENTSAETVTLNTLTDSVFGNLNGQGTCATGGSIAAGATYTCSFTGTVLGNAGDTHTDTVTAQVSDDELNTASDAGSAIVTFNDVIPSSNLTKTPGVTSIDEPGGDVTFTVEVENTSPEAVTLDSLVDDVFGDLTLLVGTCATGGTIAPGDTYSCSFTGAVSGNAGDTHTDTVTAEISDDDGNTVSDAGSADVAIDDVTPSLNVTKTPDMTSIGEPGGNVIFTVGVQNTSPEAVTLDSLFDDVFGDLDGQGTCATGGSIAAGATYTCSFTGTVLGNAGDTHTDTVTAQVSDDELNTASDDDSADVTIDDVTPTLNVTKTPGVTSIDEPGGDVTFTVEVENTSPEAVTLDSLIDTVFGDLDGQGDCVVPQTIAAGDTYSCTFTGAVSGNAGDTHTDTVTADVSDDEGNTVSDAGSASVDINDVASAIAVTKTASQTSLPVPGGSVDFTVRVDNTSPVDSVTITSLTDSVHGDLDGQGTCSVPQAIIAGGFYQCVFSASVSGSAGDSETDTVTASGTDDDGNAVSDSDSTTVTIVGVTKALVDSNQSSTDPPDVAIGEILTYSVVLGIGPGTMADMSLTDVMDRGLAFVTCESITPSSGSLTTTAGTFADICDSPTVSEEPTGSGAAADQGRRVSFDFGDVGNPTGTSQSLTVRYTVVVLNNAGNVQGVDLKNGITWTWEAGSLSASASETTVVEPGLSLSKIATPTVGLPGTTVTFTLNVAHTGSSGADAFDLVLDDIVPAGLTYVAGSLAWTGVGLEPDSYDDASPPDLSVGWDDFPLGGSSQVRFQAVLGSLSPGSIVTNQALLEWSSLSGNISSPQSSFNTLSVERTYDPGDPVNVYGVTAYAEVTVAAAALPATGFAPDRMTTLPADPDIYTALGGLWIDIPALRVQVPIIGVPLAVSGWDVTWLWHQVGYLEGTAFPTWPGNTVLTGHVSLPDGSVGPFAGLRDLVWGDEIHIHGWGSQYTYEVRQVRLVSPNSPWPYRHEALDWVTLVTCQGFDEVQGTYRSRLVVRAVLVDVRPED
jgi:LPXTG-site transpeptidase (sortase) family protein